VVSTLYNAALLANLTLVERHAHSTAVRSVPPGLDATVVYGSQDLRFRNPFPQTLSLCTRIVGDRLVVSVYTRRPTHLQVQVRTERLEVLPPRRRYHLDPSLPAGKQVVEQKGSPGERVRVIRTVVGPGGLKRTEVVSEDTYPPRDAVIRVGTR
jgi:vancomycin resistance protein YoaR